VPKIGGGEAYGYVGVTMHFGASPFSQFSSYCPINIDNDNYAPNDLALEYLFFDLGTCIQDDTQHARLCVVTTRRPAGRMPAGLRRGTPS
jgi:hypothetical protein